MRDETNMVEINFLLLAYIALPQVNRKQRAGNMTRKRTGLSFNPYSFIKQIKKTLEVMHE